MTATPWILASASPRRRDILARLGMKFRIDPSHIKEPECKPGEPPGRYVVRIARMKAKGTSEKYRAGIIIGADTIVVLGKGILGKPVDREDARSMLCRLSNRWHDVWSGLCLLDCRGKQVRAGYCRSRVHFRPLTRSEIEWYLDTGEFQDKAGAYAIQGYASLFIDRIEGCYFNIVGFPVTLFEKLCRKMEISLPDQLNV